MGWFFKKENKGWLLFFRFHDINFTFFQFSKNVSFFAPNDEIEIIAKEIIAKNLPKKTATEKAIRADAIKNVRIKKESAALIRKYGIDNIKVPDESVKEELLNRETHGFIESLKVKQELRTYLKYASVYARVIKPYTEAKLLLTQAENYTHYEELEREYLSLKA